MISTLAIIVLTAAFLAGGVPALAAAIKTGLASQLHIDSARGDRLVQWLAGGWIGFLPLAGWMIDGWGSQIIMFGGFLGMALALGLLAVGTQWLAGIFNLLVLSLASAMTMVAAATLMPHAIAPQRWSPSGSIGLGFTAVSLGYLVAAWIWPLLEHRFGYRQALLVLGLVCLWPAALVSFIPAESFPLAHPHSFLAHWGGDLRFWLLALGVLCYFFLEQVMDVWMRPFLAELGHGERIIPWLLAGFWIAFLLARSSAGWIMRPGYEGWWLLTFLLVSSMVLGNLTGAYAPSSGILGFWLAGACYGAILPTFLTIGYSIFQDQTPAAALGLLLALGAVNHLLFRPWFIAYAKTHPARAAMRIPMALGLVIAAPTLVLTLIRYLK